MVRPNITDKNIQDAFYQVLSKYKKRLSEKGDGGFVSTHECAGVIDEEYFEMHEALRADNVRHFRDEVIDVAVACIHALASMDNSGMEWK